MHTGLRLSRFLRSAPALTAVNCSPWALLLVMTSIDMIDCYSLTQRSVGCTSSNWTRRGTVPWRYVFDRHSPKNNCPLLGAVPSPLLAAFFESAGLGGHAPGEEKATPPGRRGGERVQCDRGVSSHASCHMQYSDPAPTSCPASTSPSRQQRRKPRPASPHPPRRVFFNLRQGQVTRKWLRMLVGLCATSASSAHGSLTGLWSYG